MYYYIAQYTKYIAPVCYPPASLSFTCTYQPAGIHRPFLLPAGIPFHPIYDSVGISRLGPLATWRAQPVYRIVIEQHAHHTHRIRLE